MREFKFKAWHNENKYFLNTLYMQISADGQWIDDCGDRYNTYEEVTLLQSIGQKDITGKEVYEGDIVNGLTERFTSKNYIGSSPKQRKYIGFVEYRNTSFVIVLKNQKIIDSLGGSNILNFKTFDEFEIIGNIYENPELLKN